MMLFSKINRKYAYLAAFVCTVFLAGVLFVRGMDQESSPSASQIYNLEAVETAVSLAVGAQNSSYAPGETSTEGHIILDIEEKDKTLKVYAIASYGAFGFENGVFTKVSGSGAIPTVITFLINEKGDYSLLEYKEPQDGSYYSKSIKKMFPARLHDKVFSGDDYYKELVRQQESQAADYLKSIGRTARISEGYMDRKHANIDVQASNKLFSELGKYNRLIGSCPSWLGTREQIEAGVRYIYETSQGKTDDGYDLITFRKTREDGTLIEEHKYKIVGSEPQLIK